MDKVVTPRGSFNVKFDTMEEAREHGYGLWFEHDGYQIVGDGTRAVAVEKHLTVQEQKEKLAKVLGLNVEDFKEVESCQNE